MGPRRAGRGWAAGVAVLFLQCALRRPMGAALTLCVQEGCVKHASYGAPDTRRRTACALHKAAHHVYLIGALCEYGNGTTVPCQRRGSYGFRGGPLRLCRTHRRPGMVHLQSRRCQGSGCAKQPIFGVANTTRPLFCREHKSEAHVDVVNRRCQLCSRQGVFGDPGSGRQEEQPPALYCREHSLGSHSNKWLPVNQHSAFTPSGEDTSNTTRRNNRSQLLGLDFGSDLQRRLLSSQQNLSELPILGGADRQIRVERPPRFVRLS